MTHAKSGSDATGPRAPIAFLSSVFWELADGVETPLPLRAALTEKSRALGVDLRAHMIGAAAVSEPADAIIDRCFADIKACDLLVYLQTRRHGSPVRYLEAEATISTYLEMELFAAAMLRKPILVLHERGTVPEPHLNDLLALLEQSFNARLYAVGHEADLVGAFASAVGQLCVDPNSLASLAAANIADGLSRLRTCASPIEDLDTPALKFLGRWPAPRAGGGDPDAARQLLDSVSNSDALVGASMSHGAALFRVWAALREILALDTRDSTIAMLWDRSLGLWATKASWFGIHGHIFLGPLAAVNSQIELRRLHAGLESAIDTREPIGAKASALYSVAQQMTTRARQLLHFEQAAMQATRAIARDPDGTGGAHSIRGHAQLRIARLGRPWRLFDARRDFEASLAIRELAGASAPSIGEAETELGLAMILTGQPFRGLSRLRHGVELMRGNRSPNGRAFLARGLRKLEEGARLTLRRNLAEEARRERLAIAAEVDAIDQMKDA